LSKAIGEDYNDYLTVCGPEILDPVQFNDDEYYEVETQFSKHEGCLI
jgi:hypothetical protein